MNNSTSFEQPPPVADLMAQAMALHQRGDFEPAQALYEQVLQQAPHHFDAWHLLGLLALQMQQHPRALALLDQAIRVQPNQPLAHSNRGLALQALGQNEAALASIDQAIALKPDFADAHYNRGNVLQNLQRLDAAVASYDRAIAVQPRYVQAHINRAIALKGLQQFDAALASCDLALQIQPESAEALMNRGDVLKNMKQWSAAVASYDQAIRIRPNHAQAWSNRGNALQDAGQLEAALASYDRAIAINPQLAELHYNRGNALKTLRQWAAAAASYDEAIRLKPAYGKAHSQRATSLVELKQFEAALASYDQALQYRPDDADIYSNRGFVLHALQRFDAAVASCDQALRLAPDHTQACNNRGNALQAVQRFDAAIASYDRAIALQSDFADAHYNRGLALQELQEWAQAIASYDRAIALQPDYADAFVNRGNALKHGGQFEAAIASYDEAIRLQPSQAKAHSNRGNALQELGQLDAARASYDRAIAVQPDYAEAYWNKAVLLLGMGDFSQGWPLYEWRWKIKAPVIPRRFSQPLWLGEMSLQGQTILLHAEQGLGDSIQFCRYAKQVAALGARVVLEVPRPLMGLFQGLEGVATLIQTGQALPDFDCHCPLMSLPLAFKTTLDTIPAAAFYLHADAHRLAHWGQVLGPKKGVRVGLVWSGNSAYKNDRKRSVGLAALLQHLPTHSLVDSSADASLDSSPQSSVPIEYISLQKEVRESDQAALAASGIRHFGDEIRDFADTAALCELVDVVISVDTSVAHLAGALGRPTWVLLPRVPDWRWLLDREDSPWYPSVRLYRQSDKRDWATVLERVGRDLQSRLASAAQPEPAVDVAALFAQGLALHQAGEFEAAWVLYEQVLQAQPNHFDALHLSGAGALQMKQPEKARALMEQAIAVNPNHASAHSNLGLALQELGQLEAALASLDRAIALKLDFADAHFSRGNVLQDLGRFDEAIASYDRAIAWQEKAGYCNNRGNAFKALGRFEEALESYDEAIELEPAFAQAHSNRGLALQELGRLDAAVASCEKAIALQPDLAEAHYNRGNVLKECGQWEAALASFDRAIELQADWAEAYWGKSLTLLEMGDFAQAWPLYEWRWKWPGFASPPRHFGLPLWLGETAFTPFMPSTPLQGKTILLHAEQGLGDTIQFCRYAKQVAALGARVLLEVQAPLLALCQSLEGVAQVIAKGQPLPDFDCHCPLLSLPLAFKTTLQTIPAAVSYLHADAQRLAHWAQILGPQKGLRVALVWSGSAGHCGDRKRSLGLAALMEQLPTHSSADSSPDSSVLIEYISLQKEVRAGDQVALASSGIRHFGDEIRDFADTAALCELVDVVISVDTSVAHLAGALGRPTWVLLPRALDWRWLRDREDSPWYPSMKLYRQSDKRDWSPVLARVARDLSDGGRF